MDLLGTVLARSPLGPGGGPGTTVSGETRIRLSLGVLRRGNPRPWLRLWGLGFVVSGCLLRCLPAEADTGRGDQAPGAGGTALTGRDNDAASNATGRCGVMPDYTQA